MKKRLCASFFIMILCFSLLINRIFAVVSKEEYKESAENQSRTVLNVASLRGTIYDRNLVPLTNDTYKYVAAVIPKNSSADALYKNLPSAQNDEINKKLSSMVPFTIDVPTDNIYASGIDIFEVPLRNSENQLAPHIIGQTGNDGKDGISGLESCYDSLLKTSGGFINIRYKTDALKHSLVNEPPVVSNTSENIKGGIVTTLDKDIQRIVEEKGSAMEKGAIVVMDPYGGDILASASFPSFNTLAPEKNLDDPNKPFINRCFYPFAVGSTFKLLTAATALEMGISEDLTHNCVGYIEIGANTFKCHKLSGHGIITMDEAVKKSCNTYFISLSQKVGGQNLLYKSKLLGFGKQTELAPNYTTFAGTLPSAEDLMAPEAVSNFGFGQGLLTATPIQIATLVSSMVNGGKGVTPRLVEGVTSDGRTFLSHTARYEPTPVFYPSAAEKVKNMMVSTVESGSGTKAKPEKFGAGGKTASAQSGQYIRDTEVVHAWFSGFYPAEAPKYTIVVLCEGGDSGGDIAAPIFKQICDEISDLNEVK